MNMKHIYFFLLFIITISANAQYQFIQVELVGATIGYPSGEISDLSAITNDADLNAIFQNYNVQNYEISYAFKNNFYYL